MLALYLASGSPRRKALLVQLGLTFECLANHVAEIRLPAENALRYAIRLAREKALAGVHTAPDDQPVLAADTIVTLNGDILGKPRDTRHACAILQRLSGKTHQVITAVALADRQHLCETHVITDVTFRMLTTKEIENYVASGEPMDKAGGYGIQGQAACFVRRINGSYHAVIGLPLAETLELLDEFLATKPGKTQHGH